MAREAELPPRIVTDVPFLNREGEKNSRKAMQALEANAKLFPSCWFFRPEVGLLDSRG